MGAIGFIPDMGFIGFIVVVLLKLQALRKKRPAWVHVHPGKDRFCESGCGSLPQESPF
jgi:hypothetical protein